MMKSIDQDHEAWFDRERLHFAAGDGDLAQVRQLVEEGFDLNEFDELGKTPLAYAARNGHLEVVRYLIEAGADVNAHDEAKSADPPLKCAAGTCSLQMAQLLVQNGANPSIQGWMGVTALHIARDRQRGDGPKVYQLLLDAALNPRPKPWRRG